MPRLVPLSRISRFEKPKFTSVDCNGITIKGNSSFVRRVEKAIEILKCVSTFNCVILNNITSIRESNFFQLRFSTKHVYLDSASACSDRICLASYLASIAKYNELYRKKNGPLLAAIHKRRGFNVALEMECFAYQAAVVKELKGHDRVLAILLTLPRLPDLIEEKRKSNFS